MPAMGTIVEITVGPAEPGDLIARCGELLLNLEGALSKFLPDSDIFRLNAAGGAWVQVGVSTQQLLDEALQLAGASGGVFTPVIGALSALWDVKGWLAQVAAGDRPTWPDDRLVDRARACTSPDLLEGDGCGRYRLHDGAQLDLGGIAKGYVADRLRDLCLEHTDSVLVSVGMSSLAASATRVDGRAWLAGIRDLDSARICGSVELRDKSLATSGDYLQRLPEMLSGQVIHHIIDPRTGYPAQTGIRQVSALAGSGTRAEVAATALMLSSPGELAELLAGVEWLSIGEEITQSPGLRFIEIV